MASVPAKYEPAERKTPLMSDEPDERDNAEAFTRLERGPFLLRFDPAAEKASIMAAIVDDLRWG